jgi:DNA helicase HerA-like ATPase
MKDKNQFTDYINNGYTFKGDSIILGVAMLESEAQTGVLIKAPLKTFNRHGLIAGATGTGKTKTMQAIAESLSQKGVSCLLMDIKGDLSGLAMPASPNPKIDERYKLIGLDWKPLQYPVEFLSLSNEKGVRLRATVSEFGPVLFSKILELNDTQEGVVSLIFKYCDDHHLPLLDLKDFKKTLQFLTNEGKDQIKSDYGIISTATASTILRKIIEIEQQGAETFFGEKSFEVEDLMGIDEKGFGKLSIIRLTDIQDKPKLFSTFMLSLLAEVYATFPEVGDPDQPKLVLFIDEAHLIFKNASKTLLDQIETVIKLIRSKGIGVFFVTQSPEDIPSDVLAQLGLKIQHAFRVFTANDRKALKLVAANYPLSDYYNTEELLTQLGIGEAAVTVLNEKGIPTPLAHTLLCSPASRMDILTTEELNNHVAHSALIKKYNDTIDRESAYEILSNKIKTTVENKTTDATNPSPEKEEPGMLEQAMNSTTGRQVLRTVTGVLTRSLLGALGLGATRRKKSNWF